MLHNEFWETVLEWISIHWFSRAGPAAAIRIYKETTYGYAVQPQDNVKWTSIPFGVSYFPKDFARTPRK